ncbi:glycosyltransferase family 61 protein [Acidocella facilis]|uniref:glycosyltransferase family 61 protein n=1 Tax=Acidocella facilis TaxID=525 RepID=UPI001F272014|nr:glycosyltransferase family 61 protein [Acidocella facilis]
MVNLPIQSFISKPDAALELASRAGLKNIDPYDYDLYNILKQASSTVAPITNHAIEIVDWSSALGVIKQVHAAPTGQILQPIDYLNGRPDCFPPFHGRWNSLTPEYNTISVTDGYLLLLPDAPIVLSSSRQVIEPYGSRYRGLLHYYDVDACQILDDAVTINGTVFNIIDDVWGLNFCHWLCDWLPRLAFLGSVSADKNVFVATSPLTTKFQLESLMAAGFTSDRIVQMKPHIAVRAERLIVPSDLGQIQHPAYKASPWALNYLRGSIVANLVPQKIDDLPKKLYISREDAGGRRILNEEELMNRLEKFGFKSVSLVGRSLAEQAALFNNADNIVSLHGAALSNLVFTRRNARVVEVFPETYGTPAFAIIATAGALNYATYICKHVQSGARNQLDDIVLDVDDFIEACATYL